MEKVSKADDRGPVKLFGELAQIRDEGTKSVAYTLGAVPLAYEFGQTGKYTGALIGLTAPVGSVLIRAAYSRVKYDAPVRLSIAHEGDDLIALVTHRSVGRLFCVKRLPSRQTAGILLHR